MGPTALESTTTTTTTPLIALVDVDKRYGAGVALLPTSLAIAEGELFVLLGESGSGKTTLLKMINRLVEPSGGRVLIEGRDVRDQDPVLLRRRIGYVIQNIGLFPHFTVGDNIALTPRLLRWDPATTRARTTELLRLVGLEPDTYRERMPSELSGGQRQRVGVARALAARPKILLMDEPFGALDPLTRAQLQGELARLHRELGLTTVLVTHDLSEALALADRIGVMRAGELQQVGTPGELVSAPATPYVAALMAMATSQAARVSELLAERATGGA